MMNKVVNNKIKLKFFISYIAVTVKQTFKIVSFLLISDIDIWDRFLK